MPGRSGCETPHVGCEGQAPFARLPEISRAVSSANEGLPIPLRGFNGMDRDERFDLPFLFVVFEFGLLTERSPECLHPCVVVFIAHRDTSRPPSRRRY